MRLREALREILRLTTAATATEETEAEVPLEMKRITAAISAILVTLVMVETEVEVPRETNRITAAISAILVTLVMEETEAGVL